MTTLPGSLDEKDLAVITTTNTAYGVTKHKGRLDDEYERIISSPKSPPEEYLIPSPPSPSHQPLPAVPPPAAIPPPENGGEEAVYEPIPGDKWYPLQYMDWCDVVTVGCLDFPSLDTVHTIL